MSENNEEKKPRRWKGDLARIKKELKARGLMPFVVKIAKVHFVLVDTMLGDCHLQSSVTARRALYEMLIGKGLSRMEIGVMLERDRSSVAALVNSTSRKFAGRKSRKKVQATIEPKSAPQLRDDFEEVLQASETALIASGVR